MTDAVTQNIRDTVLPLEQIRAALAGIRFGSVEIVIHDGKVVQIERKEKVRLHAETTRK